MDQSSVQQNPRAGERLLPTSRLIGDAVVEDNGPFGRSANRPGQKAFDVPVQDGVGRKPNRIGVALRLKVSVHLRLGKCRVASKKPTDLRIPVASYHRLQYRPPVISAVDLAVAQQRPLQIAKLVEAKQWVIAGAAEVAVVGRAFLLTVGRADRTVHVQDQLANRLAFADTIHQHTGQTAQRLEGLRGRVRVCVSNRLIWLVEAAV